MADGIASAVAGREGLLPIQQSADRGALPRHDRPSRHGGPDTPGCGIQDAAAVLAGRDLQFRARVVQIMLLCALVRHPIPDDVAGNVGDVRPASSASTRAWSTWRGEFAAGSLGLAARRLPRNGYEGTWNEAEASAVVHSTRVLHDAWEFDLVNDPELAARWAALETPAPERHRPQGVGDVPGARVHLPGHAGVGAAAAVPARLGARAGRLRHDGGVRGRGVRAHRAGQRRPARVLAPGHGDLVVRDRLPGHGRGALRGVTGALLVATPTWRCGSPTPCGAARCATTTRPAPTASTSSDWTGSPWPHRTVRRAAGALQPRAQVGRRGRGRIGRAVGAGRDQPVPDATPAQALAAASGIPYDAHGASV